MKTLTMMKPLLSKYLLALLALLTLSLSAWALSLQEAKALGLVGETPGGYLEAVSEASDEVAALVQQINDQRSAEYQRIAAKNKISVHDVEQLAGKKAIEKTAPGLYVKIGGRWQTK